MTSKPEENSLPPCGASLSEQGLESLIKRMEKVKSLLSEIEGPLNDSIALLTSAKLVLTASRIFPQDQKEIRESSTSQSRSRHDSTL